MHNLAHVTCFSLCLEYWNPPFTLSEQGEYFLTQKFKKKYHSLSNTKSFEKYLVIYSLIC